MTLLVARYDTARRRKKGKRKYRGRVLGPSCCLDTSLVDMTEDGTKRSPERTLASTSTD